MLVITVGSTSVGLEVHKLVNCRKEIYAIGSFMFHKLELIASAAFGDGLMQGKT